MKALSIRCVRISASDAREIAGILDNELSQGLLTDDAEWKLTQLLARIRAAINDPNTGADRT